MLLTDYAASDMLLIKGRNEKKCKCVQIPHLNCNTTGLRKFQQVVAEVLHSVDVDPYI